MTYVIKVNTFDGFYTRYYHNSYNKARKLLEIVQDYLKDSNVYSVEVIKND